jgi:hypothetical protein
MFFKKAQFERLLSHDRLELLCVAPQVLDLAIGRGPRVVWPTRRPLPASKNPLDPA